MINTILNLLNQARTVTINFVMIGFFLDMLGEELDGVWILIGAIFSYRSIISMGLNSGVNRHIPIYLAHKDHRGIRKVISTAFAYYLLPSSILAVGTAIPYLNLEA